MASFTSAVVKPRSIACSRAWCVSRIGFISQPKQSLFVNNPQDSPPSQCRYAGEALRGEQPNSGEWLPGAEHFRQSAVRFRVVEVVAAEAAWGRSS